MAEVRAISPSGLPAGAATLPAAATGREDFLRLLIAQLRAQSPLRPYEGQELAVQLAIFSQLEQLLSMRQLMEVQLGQLAGLTETVGNAVTPALVGAFVRVESSTIRLPEGGTARFGYELSEPARSVRVEIATSTGEVVRVLEFHDVPAGTHAVEWDGRAADGGLLPPGAYTVRITALRGESESMNLTPFVEGVVEAVRFTEQGAFLQVAGIEVPLAQLREIRRSP
jgi:flagellar basal-body rod modification protein FlgD